tara:strand:+ start:3301 stop:3762 length:462 start_codon:yes stop_codon:yes gene_type:complete
MALQPNRNFQIVSNCSLCGEHSLHNLNDGDLDTKQCLNCGFVTSERYKGKIGNNETYEQLPDDMKKWAVESDGYIWIPSLLTLPTGMIYPIDVDGKLQWAVAEGEKNEEGTIVYGTKDNKSYDDFHVAMFMLSKHIENKGNPKLNQIKLNPNG